MRTTSAVFKLGEGVTIKVPEQLDMKERFPIINRGAFESREEKKSEDKSEWHESSPIRHLEPSGRWVLVTAYGVPIHENGELKVAHFWVWKWEIY